MDEASVVSRLKSKRTDMAKDRPPLIVAAPGYGGDVGLRFRMMELSELRQIYKESERRAAIVGTDEAEFNSQIKVICRACTAVVYRNEAGEWADFSEPVRLDGSLGAMLGYEAETSAQALIGLFGGKTMPIGAIHGELIEWLGYTDADVSEEFVGESQSATTRSDSPRTERS